MLDLDWAIQAHGGFRLSEDFHSRGGTRVSAHFASSTDPMRFTVEPSRNSSWQHSSLGA